MIGSHKKTVKEILGRGPIHPFPARMAPGIALEALGEVEMPLRVLDPMVGSGTVLAVARANGHQAIGVDLDPLAVLLAGVWTRTVDPHEIREAAETVLASARSKCASLTVGGAYPVGSDAETRSFVSYWFDGYARRQLTALSCAISEYPNRKVRDLLWCGFSRLIITKSAGASLAMDLSHSRPHKTYERAPIKPFTRFLAAVEIVVSNCPRAGRQPVGPVAVSKHGDARDLDIDSASIDLVLTSPPYLNAIDYMRCSKFSLVWMGYNVGHLRRIRGDSIGAEASSDEASGVPWVRSLIERMGFVHELSSRTLGILTRYVFDMDRALAEVSRVLKASGRAVYVVGDSVVRGTFVRNSQIVQAAAERHGLVLDTRQSRALPANRRYLPPPKTCASSTSIDRRMRREVVLAFQKLAA